MGGVPLAEHCRMPRVSTSIGPMSYGCDVNMGCWSTEIKANKIRQCRMCKTKWSELTVTYGAVQQPDAQQNHETKNSRQHCEYLQLASKRNSNLKLNGRKSKKIRGQHSHRLRALMTRNRDSIVNGLVDGWMEGRKESGWTTSSVVTFTAPN